MKIVQRLLACLCAVLLLTACGHGKPLVRTELVEVPVVQYAALPADLTDPVPEPPPPPMSCVLGLLPTVCALDAILRELDWKALLQRVNEDRMTAKKLTDEAAASRLTSSDSEKPR